MITAEHFTIIILGSFLFLDLYKEKAIRLKKKRDYRPEVECDRFQRKNHYDLLKSNK